MTQDQIDNLKKLQNEAADIIAGKIGFPRCVEWQRDYVVACYEAMPHIFKQIKPVK